MGTSDETVSQAWETLLEGLAMADVREGERREAPGDAPPLAGVVEATGTAQHPELLLRLDRPAPGIAHLFAMPMGGLVLVPMRLYLYGEDADPVAARDRGAWQEWMAQRFGPAPSTA